MAIRLTRIYTRTGDTGDTALVGGRRVPKDAARIEAYGTIDELNSVIGLARVFNAERLKKGKASRWLDGIFRQIQNELFDLGSELATPDDAAYEGMHRVGEAEVKCSRRSWTRPEGPGRAQIVSCCRGAGAWEAFSTGSTVCRRAERRVLALSRVETLSPGARLRQPAERSPFVLSRWVGKNGRRDEYLWERGLASHARQET